LTKLANRQYQRMTADTGTLAQRLKGAIEYHIILALLAWWNKLVLAKKSARGGRSPHVNPTSPIHTKFSLFTDKFGVQAESGDGDGDGDDTDMESGPNTPPPLSP
jgi:hypothetical protein